MRQIRIFLIIIIALTFQAFAQPERKPPREVMRKIEQLENVKLLEILNMDEETSVRFFTRRNTFKQKIHKLEEKSDELIDKIESDLKESDDNKNLKELIDNYLSVQESIGKEKLEFLNSVSDLLTEKQIARLLVFDKRFKEELKSMFFKERTRRFRN